MASALRYCMEVAIDFIAWLARHPFSTCHHVPWCSLIALREVNYFWQQVGGFTVFWQMRHKFLFLTAIKRTTSDICLYPGQINEIYPTKVVSIDS